MAPLKRTYLCVVATVHWLFYPKYQFQTMDNLTQKARISAWKNSLSTTRSNDFQRSYVEHLSVEQILSQSVNKTNWSCYNFIVFYDTDSHPSD